MAGNERQTHVSYDELSIGAESCVQDSKFGENHLNSEDSSFAGNEAEGINTSTFNDHMSNDESSALLFATSPRNNTNIQSLMNLLKGNIGTGILALPSAFKYGGLWVGFVGIFILGCISVHCMHLLVVCSHQICNRTGRSYLSYGDVMKECLNYGPEPFKRFRNFGSWIINIFLCITQFGFCTVYILFVADNIRQVIEEYTDVRFNIRLYEFFIFLALLPYLSIRNLKVLSFFSALANFNMVVGLVITLVYCFQDLPSYTLRPAFASWTTLPLYFGIAIYAFEGIGVVLPIENKMKTPEDFGGWTGLINLGMTIAVALYAAVGFYGYLRFGDDVKGSLTLNLPPEGLYSAVKVLFATAIFCTYGVQFYVPIEIIWSHMERGLSDHSWKKKYGEYILRAAFLFMTFVLAIIIPCLDLVISLIGALSSSAVALIFPAFLDILTFWSVTNGLGRYYWKLIKDILIMLLGFIGFIVGTITTLISIVHAFQLGAC